MNLLANIHKFGDNIDTDMIIAGRHMANTDPAYLAQHCLEVHAPDFHTRVTQGDVLFAGVNFGCGSSRELAPIALKATGLACIVAHSYSRIFFRSAVNIALPALICPEAVDAAQDGDQATVDIREGKIVLGGRTFFAQPLPENLLEIVHAGGLVPLIRQRLGATAS